MSDKEKNRRSSLNSIKNSDEDKGKKNSIKPEAVSEDEDVQGKKIFRFQISSWYPMYYNLVQMEMDYFENWTSISYYYSFLLSFRKEYQRKVSSSL